MRSLLILLLPLSLFSQGLKDSLMVKYEHFIYFDSNEFILKEEKEKEILELIIINNKFKNLRFFVDAYTDDLGSEEYNLNLSYRRKQSIVEFLLKQGVHDSLIIASYHGESNPISPIKNKIGREKNRRAVLRLIQNKKFLNIKGVVVDEIADFGVYSEIEIRTKDFKFKTSTDDAGEFDMWIPFDETVFLEVNSEGYFFNSVQLKVGDELIKKKVRIPIEKLTLGKQYKLVNMHFKGGMAIMIDRSKPELNQLKKFMFLNSDVCIEIAGHINGPGSPPSELGSFHYELSVARSLVVKEEMIQFGIKQERMLSRGYGNWYMVYPDAITAVHQEENRRVEIVISHCDSISTLQDHSVDDISIFLDEPIDKFYNENTFNEDIKHFPSHAVIDLSVQLKKMKEAGFHLTLYTYKEILSAFPELPPLKNK